MSVRYASSQSKPGDWDMAGKQEPEGIVFTKPKFRLVYSQDELRGDFRGRMNAKIRLAPEQGDRQHTVPADAGKPPH